MRTTLTLDPDVAERIRQETASGRVSLKQVVNEGLRRGLMMKEATARKPFRVRPHSSDYQPGVDRAKLSQMVDELDALAFADASGKKRA
ncbi:MAG: hypothetical protein JJT96_19580 [Opitutales bacterium]|nr:hypothetical protein [Opitutales bacterium]